MDEQPGRIHQKKGDHGHVETRDPEFPELTKLRADDRQRHIERAMEMGMSREEAEKHAESDLADRDETEPTSSGAPGDRPL